MSVTHQKALSCGTAFVLFPRIGSTKSCYLIYNFEPDNITKTLFYQPDPHITGEYYVEI